MSENEISFDLPPYIRVYKDGKIQRFLGDSLPAGVDPITGVQSKDVSIPPPDSGIAARLYMPKTTDPHRKLPLLIYFHGGAFVTGSNSSRLYHPYLNTLVANSQIVAVSVEYRLAPEHPLPIAYEDSWAAIRWVASHRTGSGTNPWLNQFADFENVFFAGDSAGANISHHMGIRVGLCDSTLFKLVGIIMVHPYFGGVEVVPNEDTEGRWLSDKLWKIAKPNSSGLDDPDINPGKDPRVSGMGCERILVCIAEKDPLKERGWYYGEVMSKLSGWNGKIEVVEDKGEGHIFHLRKRLHEKALVMIKRVNDFINVGVQNCGGNFRLSRY